MKRGIIIALLVVLLSLIVVNGVFAQNYELILRLSRDFGYSAISSNKIQGLFSITASSTEKLTKVTFFIDDINLGIIENEPYKLQFNTDHYMTGPHQIFAKGETASGKIILSQSIPLTFISSEESRSETFKLIIPILGISLLVIILTSIVPTLIQRKRGSIPLGEHRNYGVAGGSICSKCRRPFTRHVMSPNLLVGKLEICPHCGKWGLYRSLPIDVLRQAEENELQASKKSISAEENQRSAEDLIRKQLDDSRFED